jgi:hypothetical protein
MIEHRSWENHMKRSLRGLCLISLCGVFFAIARAKLPDRFSGWETKAPQTISGPQLASFAAEHAGIIREYGFVSGERREYSKENSRLTVTLWRMQDATGSFGLFTFLREAGMQGVEAEDRIAQAPGRWLIQRGPYVIDIAGQGISAEEAKLLLAVLPAVRGSENVLPTLPAYLPEEGLVDQSPKLLLGPVAFERLEKHLPSSAIGFEMGAEAEFAQYRVGGDNLRLLLVSYPTPQMAAKKLQSFLQLPSVAEGQAGRKVFIQRKGSLLAFVLDAREQSAAESLLDRVHYESTITWNEYVPSARDNLANLLLAIFTLTGFVLLFAIVAGISFGGFRVFAKKFLPYEIFDRPSQMEIIQLHLSDQ